MNVLFVTPDWIFDQDSGAKVRDFRLLSTLARHYQVELMTWAREGSGEVDVHDHKVQWEGLPRALGRMFAVRSLSGLPSAQARLAHPAAVEKLRAKVRAGTVVHCSGMEPFWAVRNLGVPIVVDVQDLEYRLRLSLLPGTTRLRRRVGLACQAALLWIAERRMVLHPATTALVSVSAEIADRISRWHPHARIAVVRNGFQRLDLSAERCVGRNVTFVGAMDYVPNRRAAEVLIRVVAPYLERHVPGARIRLVGKKPPLDLLEALAPSNVDALGFVPDLKTVYESTAVVVVPLSDGDGTKVKTIEALGNGMCVVTTAEGRRGLSGIAGEHFIEVRSVEDLCVALRDLLLDPARAERIGRAALAHYAMGDWEASGTDLLRIYEEVALHARNYAHIV